MAQPSVATQPREKRVRNFQEVSLGYHKKLSVEESTRCPQCADAPCQKGCPLGIDVAGFIRLLREGSISAAFEKIRQFNPLPGICGRICSAPCEKACVLSAENAPIGVRALERFASDHGRARAQRKEKPASTGKKIAIIGSGPAGLSAADQLADRGYAVTIFETMDRAGGVLRYGIPEFRLPKNVLDQDIADIQAKGVVIKLNTFMGQTQTLTDLEKEGFKAVLLAMGAGIPKVINLPGSQLGGVYYGEEFLMRVNLNKANIFAQKTPNFVLGPKVVVIGSGNTALDCARAAARYGRDVTLVFRRTEDDMRVRLVERQYAKEEGVKFEPLVRPVEILSNGQGFVGAVKCIRMDFADINGTDQWQLMEVPESEFVMDVDTVIIAVGHKPNSLLAKKEKDFKFNEDGTIWADAATGMTSCKGIFACGNVATNAGPVVEAMAAGKRAAEKIDHYFKAYVS